MTKTELTSAQAAVEKELKRQKVSGAALTGKMKNRVKSNPAAAMYAVGDEISLPDNDDNLFESSYGGFGVVAACKSANGAVGAKTVFFSALDREVAEYGDDLKPTGLICPASTKENHEVFDLVHNKIDDLEIWNAIKGKTLKVADTVKVKAARYNRDGQITGTRERELPVFAFSE